jgi:integrase
MKWCAVSTSTGPVRRSCCWKKRWTATSARCPPASGKARPYAESHKAKALKKKFGAYSLAAITPDLVAEYRDERLAADKSASTVRLELSLLSHLFTIAIKEWRVGLFYNPVANIRKPAPAKGRDRRLTADEEKALFKACDKHSNPMLGWIARIALYTGMRAGEIKSLTRRQVNPGQSH